MRLSCSQISVTLSRFPRVLLLKVRFFQSGQAGFRTEHRGWACRDGWLYLYLCVEESWHTIKAPVICVILSSRHYFGLITRVLQPKHVTTSRINSGSFQRSSSQPR